MSDDFNESAQRFIRLTARLRRLEPGETPAEIMNEVSPSQLALIEYIANHPHCGVQEVAEALRLATPTVSIGVRTLERNGLIARQPNPLDRRAVQLSLTSKGEEVYQRASAFHRQKFEHLLSGLSPEERETLISLLEKALNAAEQNKETQS